MEVLDLLGNCNDCFIAKIHLDKFYIVNIILNSIVSIIADF